MKQTTSKKITFLNFLLIALIVLLHSNNKETPDYSSVVTGGAIEFIYISLTKICETAVPTFFALSGYLFFRKLTKETLLQKVKRRFRTVLLPYVIWNSIFYIAYFAMDLIPFISNKINVKMPGFSIGMLLFDNYSNPPLWFLLKLFYLQLMSPIAFVVIKRVHKYVVAVVLVIMAIADIAFDVGYSSILHWVPVYFGAGFVSFYYGEWVENICEIQMQRKKHLALIITIGVFFLGIFVKPIQWITAPVFWWGVLSLMKHTPNRKFFQESFFVFCTHYFFILVVRKIFVILLGISPLKMVITYIATFVLVLIITTALGVSLKKFAPKAHNILCGGR